MVAATEKNIGNVLLQKGDYENALLRYQRALVIEEQALGRFHVKVAVTLSNIAGVNNSQGKFQEALANMEKVLEIQLKCLGGSHASVAGTKMNIGLVYCELGNKTKQLQLDREGGPWNARTDLPHVRLAQDVTCTCKNQKV
jgi:tetratricopeptide (TPR) repeat protein